MQASTPVAFRDELLQHNPWTGFAGIGGNDNEDERVPGGGV